MWEQFGEWKPTHKLRYVKDGETRTLQQKWECEVRRKYGGCFSRIHKEVRGEWRDVKELDRNDRYSWARGRYDD